MCNENCILPQLIIQQILNYILRCCKITALAQYHQHLKEFDLCFVSKGHSPFVMFCVLCTIHYTLLLCHHYYFIFICTYICMYVCMYGCTYICIYMCMYVCMHISKCMYACMYVCMCVCVCLCMYEFMCVCFHVCMYIYACCVYVFM